MVMARTAMSRHPLSIGTGSERAPIRSNSSDLGEFVPTVFICDQHERGDWPHCSLDRVEDLDRRTREAEVGLNGDGLGAERLQLIAQPPQQRGR